MKNQQNNITFTKKIKLLIILIVLSVFGIKNLNAQSDSIRANFIKEYNIKKYGTSEEKLLLGLLKNEEYFKNADYILEVKWIPEAIEKRELNIPFEDLTADDIYRGWTLKVLNVYKGENVKWGDTVVAFAKGGRYCIKYSEPDPDNPFSEFLREKCIGSNYDSNGDLGISFGTTNSTIIFGYNTEFPKMYKYKNDRYLKMKIQNKAKAAIFLEYQNIHGLNNLHFTNREELYDYMRQYEGLTVPYPIRNITPEENQKTLDNWNKIIKEKLDSIEEHKKT